MPTTVIYCRQGSGDRQMVVDAATLAGIATKISNPSVNHHFVILTSPESEIDLHNHFIEQYQHNPDYTIFFDYNHPLCQHEVFGPRVVRGNQPVRKSSTSEKGGLRPPSLQSAPLQQFVGGLTEITPLTMATYYHFPSYNFPAINSLDRPQIAVISLEEHIKPVI